MKKTGRLLSIIIIVFLSTKTIFAENKYEIPRVDLISIETPGILELTSEQQQIKAYLMFQSNEINFIYPTLVRLENGFTLAFDKRSYNIDFYKNENFSGPQNVTVNEDWGAYSRYTLKANNYDSTLSRNAVASEVIGMMNSPYGIFPDAPNSGASDGIPVELYIDREYRGIYVWTILLDPWLFGTNSEDRNIIVLQGDNGLAAAVLFMDEIDNMYDSGWIIAVGPNNDPDGITSVMEKVNRLIRFVTESSDEEFRTHFREYFDLDASLNYYCFCAYTNTTDNMGRNMLLATLDGNVWYPSLFNLQTSFGLFYNGEGIYSPQNRVEYFQGGNSLFWTRLAENFASELAERYWKMRHSILKENIIMGLFEGFHDKIPEEAWQRERGKWSEVPGIEYDLETIREHLQEREPFIDDIFAQILPEPEQEIDPRLIYELELPYKGKKDSYLDTGINLYEEEMDYTILLKVKTGDLQSSQMTILSNSNNAMQGLIIQTAGNGTDEYTAFFAGENQYEALYALDSDGYAYITVRKNGDDYTFFGKSVDDTRQVTSRTSTDIDTDLILGGRLTVNWDGSTEVTDSYTGRIVQCRVYNQALENEEIAEIIAAMKAE